MKPITLLIVDDHPVFRQGMRDVLETDPQIQVVAEAADGEVAIERAFESRPDVILMDINLPTTNGLQVTRKINARFEQWIRERPEDWFCTNRLWPKDAEPAPGSGRLAEGSPGPA